MLRTLKNAVIFGAVVSGAVIVAVLFGAGLFFRSFAISSESMSPTLLQRDYVLASRGLSGADIRRGAIVLFERQGVSWISRIVGLPGDRVQVRDGRLWINGVAAPIDDLGTDKITESFGFSHSVMRLRETLPGAGPHEIYDFGPDHAVDNTGVYVVPPGHVFLMGDNRDNALDSRVQPAAGGPGYVAIDSLTGQARYLLRWKGGPSFHTL